MTLSRRLCRRCGRSGGELTENGCPTCGPHAPIERVRDGLPQPANRAPRLPSWRDLAGILAERVYHNAECRAHPDESEPGDGCPFCKDRAAYRLWERKSGKTHRDPPGPAGQMVNVFDLVRRDRAAGMPPKLGESDIDE
jgi:hypothetical protein